MKNRRSLFALPYVVWMALFVVAPIIMVVIYAFTSAGVTAAEIGDFTVNNFTGMGTYVSIFARSFQLAIIATIICLLIGYPLAYRVSFSLMRSTPLERSETGSTAAMMSGNRP